MKPFNIRISYGRQQLTLTILPVADDVFKIIYYNGILGGVKKQGKQWELLSLDEVTGEDLPLHEPKHGEDRIEIELTEQIADRIGAEIELYLEHED